MRLTSLMVLSAALALSPEVSAQTSRQEERGLYLTMFRSPATGIEVRAGHTAAYLGYYPTILTRDGNRANTNFIRVGVTYYMRAEGASPYVSPSLLWSLDADWRSGALTEVGFRLPLYRRLSGRLGAGVLTTLDRQVRVNPTIGLDLGLGAGR
jgi:hypothetical protein